MSVPHRLLIGAGLAASLLNLSACRTTSTSNDAGRPKPPSGGSTPPSALCSIHDLDGTAIPATFTGTLQKTTRTRAANHVVQLNSIDTACCTDFDRVVFDFDGLRLPPLYTVEYVNGPVSQCGSGANEPLSGHAILKIN